MPTPTRRTLLRAAAAAGAATLAPSTVGTGVADHDADRGYRSTDGATQPGQYTTAPSEEHYVETSYTLPDAAGGAEESPTLYGQVIWPRTDDGTKRKDVPVILTYSPYNDIVSPQSEVASIANDAVADYYVQRGYARAVFDLVGTRNSGGCYDYGGYRERVTGKQLVEYLGGEPDAAGAYADRDGGSVGTRPVGMIGASYNGTTQLAAAVEDPDHLAAIIPQVAIDRWYDYAFGGGIRYFLNNQYPTDEGFDTPLAFDLGFGFVPGLNADDGQRFVDTNRRRFAPCDAVAHTERAYEPDPVYDGFWERRDYRRRAENVSAAVFLEAGWLDHNVKHWDSTRFFRALPADVPKKLVMGQWPHASSEFADAQDVRHAWFDEFLTGRDTGVRDLPAVDTQLNTGERVQHDAWPPKGTAFAGYPGGLTGEESLRAPHATDERGVWTLGRTTDEADLGLHGTNLAVYADSEPPLTETEMFATDGSTEDHLKFLSDPVGSPTRIAGSPVLRLSVASTHESTQFTPVLYDQAPDGSREVITRGFLNARNRNGLDESAPVPTDEAYRAPVEFWDVDWLLREGHRLGVVVASDNRAWCLGDADGTAVNELLLGESTLELPLGPPALDVAGDRTDDGDLFTAGQTNRIDLSVESAGGEDVVVRDVVPGSWEVSTDTGDADHVADVGGVTHVYFDGAPAASQDLTYFVTAPDEGGEFPFGPAQATRLDDTGWVDVPGTADTSYVVPTDTELPL